MPTEGALGAVSPSGVGQTTRRVRVCRPTRRNPANFVCKKVPFHLQVGNSCWHAAFNMVNGFHAGTSRLLTSYVDHPRLHDKGEYQHIPNNLLKQVLNNENLSPIPGCMDGTRQFQVQELRDMLKKSGPIAFAWQPEHMPWTGETRARNHWSVIVDADVATNTIVYHNPVDKKLENSEMTLDEFNRQRFRAHDHTMLQRLRSEDVVDPGFVTWTEMTVRPSTKRPLDFVCRQVPYVDALPFGSAEAAFEMVRGFHDLHARFPGSDVDVHGEVQKDKPKVGPGTRTLDEMIGHERLAPVQGCNDATALKERLEKFGPIAFAWQPEYIDAFRPPSKAHQWSVVVDADPATDSIVYNDPFQKRENCVMTMAEFNRQLYGSDQAMLQRRPPGEALIASEHAG